MWRLYFLFTAARDTRWMSRYSYQFGEIENRDLAGVSPGVQKHSMNMPLLPLFAMGAIPGHP
jgi:hypothetical protein